MKGRGAWFILHVILVLGLLLFTLMSIFNLGGYLFWLEVLAVFGLLLIGGLAVVRYVESGERRLLLWMYIVGGLNVLVVTSLSGKLSWQALILAVVGAILAFPYARQREEEGVGEEQFNGKEEEAPQEPIDADVTLVPQKKASARKKKAKRKKTK